MKTFGGFRLGDEFFYGELRGDEVHRLSEPYWIQVQPTGEILPLANLQIDVPVAPSKLIAVGLNYADHIAEMKRTEIGAPLIWFKAPSSLLAHHGAIEVAFAEQQTEFEVELAVVIGSRTCRMIHSVAQIISFFSQPLTLFPGDVILTGTPAGVGPTQAGDELEAEI